MGTRPLHGNHLTRGHAHLIEWRRIVRTGQAVSRFGYPCRENSYQPVVSTYYPRGGSWPEVGLPLSMATRVPWNAAAGGGQEPASAPVPLLPMFSRCIRRMRATSQIISKGIGPKTSNQCQNEI